MGYQERKRDFHEARWDEPIIMELGSPGERGVLVPKADPRVAKATGTVEDLLPAGLKRKKAPKLPEMSQMQVLRHYMRLSQETIGTDINIDIQYLDIIGIVRDDTHSLVYVLDITDRKFRRHRCCHSRYHNEIGNRMNHNQLFFSGI